MTETKVPYLPLGARRAQTETERYSGNRSRECVEDIEQGRISPELLALAVRIDAALANPARSGYEECDDYGWVHVTYRPPGRTEAFARAYGSAEETDIVRSGFGLRCTHRLAHCVSIAAQLRDIARRTGPVTVRLTPETCRVLRGERSQTFVVEVPT